MIVFLHGLNTYGDDEIHIGPLRFGPMHAALERALTSAGLKFTTLLDLGMGSPDELARKAFSSLEGSILKTEKLHLLGQSTGGLVAVSLASLLQDRVKSVITIGTPHRGSRSAELGLEFPSRHPKLTGLISRAGYDPRQKSKIFERYTSQALQGFHDARPLHTSTRIYSALCKVDERSLSWPLALLGLFQKYQAPGDGLIELDSQVYGIPLGPFQLDHYGELGYFPHLSGNRRRQARAEFERMITEIIGIVSK